MLSNLHKACYNSYFSFVCCNMRACFLGFLFCPVPMVVRSRRIPKKVYISDKTDQPICSGFLLTLVIYINPLFLSMLATWLSTLFSGTGHILLLRCLNRTVERVSFFPEYSCSYCPTSTSCLVFPPILPAWLPTNQRLFKT